jgi:hypothetical protein
MSSWNNQESQTQSMSALLQNSFSLSNLSCNVDNGNGSAMPVAWWQWQWGQLGGNTAMDMASIGAAAAAQRRQWWYQCCKMAAWWHNGGVMRTRDYKVCNYETDDKAELMEDNFGDEGEDDDSFRGQLA